MYAWDLALRGDRILSPTARAKLFTPYVPLDPKDTGDKGSYGYGWMMGKLEGRRSYIGHPGASDFGVKAEHYRFPDDGVTVIVLSNRLPLPGPKDENGRLAGRVAEVVLGQ
jgi:CubicO group peptidase (beta-lactamase class C family)